MLMLHDFLDMYPLNSACKFQLIGNLHCDNYTIYIKTAYCGTKTDELISVILCLKSQF